MKNILLSFNQTTLSGSVRLEGSKSISNRLLIMQALSDSPALIHHLSPGDDTQALQRILLSKEEVGDVGAAGTTMRFLTAYYACRNGKKTLTGSTRMLQRPIGILVDALRSLGATIHYLGEEGYPPLEIHGRELEGGVLQIRADVSSQYISSLLMCAPLMKNGLQLQMEGKIGSLPYIKMTLELMRTMGLGFEMNGNTIHVFPGKYEGIEMWVEGDWSAASYYFSMAAIFHKSAIRIDGLFPESLQGDSQLVRIYEQLGVEADFHNKHLLLSGTGKVVDTFQYDFTECPDLAQTVAVTCAALGVPARFTGLESLRIKETDRTAALAAELMKFNVRFTQEEDTWVLQGKAERKDGVSIRTYEDHRMAMAFAPLAILQPITIQHPEVVAKSYPSFWDDLSRLGFSSTPSS
jgi:3-phosphoshikimate 1-carboxyvinyltransferase